MYNLQRSRLEYYVRTLLGSTIRTTIVDLTPPTIGPSHHRVWNREDKTRDWDRFVYSTCSVLLAPLDPKHMFGRGNQPAIGFLRKTLSHHHHWMMKPVGCPRPAAVGGSERWWLQHLGWSETNENLQFRHQRALDRPFPSIGSPNLSPPTRPYAK
jgi:hypothetical protein